MLLDTASLYFRAFYGVPDSIRAPDGTPINAVRGLMDFIARLITDHSPTHLVACWDDDWRPQFRVDAIPSYKLHRVAEDPALIAANAEAVPDDLQPQVELIIEALALLGICRIGAAGYEADDVIGSLATQAHDPVAVVTGDRDLFQLIDDSKPIKVLYTAAKGVGAAEVFDEAAVLKKYGIRASQYADLALLRGDPSDGLPGVRGIGEKTATKLLNEYGSVEELMSAVLSGKARLTPSLAAKLREGADYLEIAKPVVSVAKDITFPDFDATLPAMPAAPAELEAFTRRWGLTGSISRVALALRWREEADPDDVLYRPIAR